MGAYVHKGVACNACLSNDIIGTRYKCLICPDYDLCAPCYTQQQSPHSGHEMIEIITTTDDSGLDAFFARQLPVILTGDWISASDIPYPEQTDAHLEQAYGCNKSQLIRNVIGEVKAAESIEQGLALIDCAVHANPETPEFMAMKAALLLKSRKVAESLLCLSDAFEVIRAHNRVACFGYILSYAWEIMMLAHRHPLKFYVTQKHAHNNEGIASALLYLVDAALKHGHQAIVRFCSWSLYFAISLHQLELKYHQFAKAAVVTRLCVAYSPYGPKIQVTISLVNEARLCVEDLPTISQRLLMPFILRVEIQVRTMLGHFEAILVKVEETIAYITSAVQTAANDDEAASLREMLLPIYEDAATLADMQGNSQEALNFVQAAIDLMQPDNPSIFRFLQMRLEYSIRRRNRYQGGPNACRIEEMQAEIRQALSAMDENGCCRISSDHDIEAALWQVRRHIALEEHAKAKEVLQNAICGYSRHGKVNMAILIGVHIAAAKTCVKMNDYDGLIEHVSLAEHSIRQMPKRTEVFCSDRLYRAEHLLSDCASLRSVAVLGRYGQQPPGSPEFAAWWEAARAAISANEECLTLYQLLFQKAEARFDQLSVVSLPIVRTLTRAMQAICYLTGNFLKVLDAAEAFRGIALERKLGSSETHLKGWRKTGGIANSMDVTIVIYADISSPVTYWLIGNHGKRNVGGSPPSWMIYKDIDAPGQVASMSTRKFCSLLALNGLAVGADVAEEILAETDPGTYSNSMSRGPDAAVAERLLADVALYAQREQTVKDQVPLPAMRIQLSHASLTHLYQHYIQPMEAQLPAPGAALVFIAEGQNHKVPLALLKDTSGAMLFEKYVIAYAPSAGVLEIVASGLAKLAAKTNISCMGQDAVCVVGNPVFKRHQDLRFAQEEAQKVADVWNSQLLVGAAATKTAVKGRMQKAVVIHFATHGSAEKQDSFSLLPGACFVTADNPANSTDADWVITAAEVERMNLNGCALVFLNSCNAGTGDTRSAEGLLGLVSAFIRAGAKAVVSCCEPVADLEIVCEFAEMFHGIYRNETKFDAPAALREAMLRMLRSDEHKDRLEHWGRYTCTCGVLPPELRHVPEKVQSA